MWLSTIVPSKVSLQLQCRCEKQLSSWRWLFHQWCNECQIIVFYGFDDISVMFGDIKKGPVLLPRNCKVFGARNEFPLPPLLLSELNRWTVEKSSRQKLRMNFERSWPFPSREESFAKADWCRWFFGVHSITVSVYNNTPLRRDRNRQFREGYHVFVINNVYCAEKLIQRDDGANLVWCFLCRKVVSRRKRIVGSQL